MRLRRPVPLQRRWLRHGAVALTLAFALAGCGDGEKESSSAASYEAAALTEAEIRRAVARLKVQPEPVPLPTAKVATVDPHLVALIRQLDEAEIGSGWSIPEDDPFLVTLGPANTREPGPGAKTERFTERRVDLKALTLRFDAVPSEQIGRILVRARFTDTPYFIVRWPQSPGIQIQVEDTESVGEYSISTEGLARWDGKLEKISLLVPVQESLPEPEIELELLGLVDRLAAFSQPADVNRARIGRVVREAVYMHGTTRIDFPAADLPPKGRLSLGAAVLAEPMPLEVTIEHSGGVEKLFSKEISDTANWQDINLPLPEIEGPARVVVEVGGETDRILFLSNPTIYMPQESPPRLIFYLIDTLGALHTSLHGYPRETSPNLERMASEGVWFQNAFANAAYTPESVPSMMASLHTKSHGLTKKFQRFSPDFLTLQQALSAAGYATVAFSTNANAGPHRGTDVGFDSFHDHLAFGTYEEALRTVPIDQVVSWLAAHHDRPAFIYIHTAEPHSPYAPPPPFDDLFDPEYNASMGRYPVPQSLALGREFQFQPREVSHLEALYDGEIAFADHALGVFQRVLDERDHLENALMVVTADHGEEFMEHGNRVGHGGSLFSQLVKIPLVFWGDRLERSGIEVDQNVQLLDLTPTLLELFGIEVEAPFQGDSLVPLLRGETRLFENRALITATYMPDAPWFGLIEGDWKLSIRGAWKPRVLLHDLVNDPEDLRNQAEKHPDVVGRMIRRLVDEYEQLPRYQGQAANRYEISQEQMERLRALGYIQ